MSWLRTGPTRELCGKEPSQKKELFRNGGNFTLDRCLSMGDPFRNSVPAPLSASLWVNHSYSKFAKFGCTG